jgi:uridylate kinase
MRHFHPASKHPVVISLGGSIVYDSTGLLCANSLNEIASFIAEAAKHTPLALVVGGGFKGRAYANEAKKRGATEFEADDAAIRATRENARAFARALHHVGAHALYCTEFRTAKHLLNRGIIPVMGGQMPGLTTDACAVLLAELVRAGKVVNASNVDGVYDKDPSKRGAKKFKKLGHAELVQLAAKQDARHPGQHFVFDCFACKLAGRTRLRIEFVDGRNYAQFIAALENKPHAGTIVA